MHTGLKDTSTSQIRKPGNRCSRAVLDSIRRTKRTAEGCAWGHSLDSFFCATAADEENYSWTDVWTTSVLEELGVLNSDGKPAPREPVMRARNPWPVVEIPRDGDSSPSLGDVDPGSDHEDSNEGPVIACQPWPRDAAASAEPAITHADDPFQIDGFPKLEEFIPSQYLPRVLCIHDPDGRVSGTESADTVHYRRIYPGLNFDSQDHKSLPTDCADSGHLYLTRQSRVGCGHHSNVYRASLRLPAPASKTQTSVVAKVAVPRREAREFLHHEAATYNAFPEHLAQEFCGYALVPGLKYPVPVGKVVPNFFGYYIPDGAGYDAGDIAAPSPILLLEDCGGPIDPQNLSHDNKAECFSLFLRLHLSGFLQKSAFKKNILVQPGPLTVPPANRSLQSPNFRIIDFGRAMQRPRGNQKEWLDEKETEVKEVQRVLRIPRHSMC
ncbi:hypothetical protein DFH07DRAFT_857864 [Mycena maculata]|uniref:Protein kinase domain-containing protein n=1 Tax=Mycena maculata TaxID=230809 RepID=A0AAD7HJN1_9AGAR|nr:hypothetical protein DFH07DRAFT_857864 [Mycena maculata]